MVSRSIFSRDRVTIAGVLNLTPDSFSDGGRFVSTASGSERVDVEAALEAASQLLAGGADLLDVGGESTRPGSEPVTAEREIERTRDVVQALCERLAAPVSIDTQKRPVAEAALAAGATVVNDVSGLRTDPSLAGLVADSGAWLIVGHMRGTPADMQRAPHYDDVLSEVARDLQVSIKCASSEGVSLDRIVADPGIGFGKRLEDNLRLIAHVDWLRDRLACPILIGASRKSFLGHLIGDPTADREVASQAACAVAVFAGADAVRVHDAASAVQAAAVGRALREARRKELT